MYPGDARSSLAELVSNSMSPDPSFRALAEEFRRRWSEGETPSVDSYLERLEASRPFQASELIFLEYLLRVDRGEKPAPESFFRRFPEHRDYLERLFALDLNQIPPDLESWVVASFMPSVGSKLGTYELVCELGKGGFATVFLTRDETLPGANFVIKVTSRITNEPQLMARLRHSNIVEVTLQTTTNDGRFQLIRMSYHGGATLASILKLRGKTRPTSGLDLLRLLDQSSEPFPKAREGASEVRATLARMSWNKACAWIVTRMADALEHADGQQVNHGDVKPSNILIGEDGVPRLLDFNLARDRVDRTNFEASTDCLGGTLVYLAPEQLNRLRGAETNTAGVRSPGLRADLYSLGIVLLEMVADLDVTRLLKTRPTLEWVCVSLYEERELGIDGFRRYSRLNRIPPGLRPILRRLLEPNPADRYGSGLELAEDLRAYIEDRPPPNAGGVPVVTRAALRLKRNRKRIGIATALTAAVLLVLGSFHYRLECVQGENIKRAHDSFLELNHGEIYLSFPRRGVEGWNPEPEAPDPVISSLGLGEGPYLIDRPGFWTLSRADQDEIEAFALEQVYRKAASLADRPTSRKREWTRALVLVDWVVARRPIDSFLTLRKQLRRKLEIRGTEGETDEVPRRSPEWLDYFVAGVASSSLHARNARGMYSGATEKMPTNFWVAHRRAGVAWRLDSIKEAEENLRICLERRPDHALLKTQLALILMRRGAYDEALFVLEDAERHGVLPEQAIDIKTLLSLIAEQHAVTAELIEEAASRRAPNRREEEWERKRREFYAKLRYDYILRVRNPSSSTRARDVARFERSELQQLRSHFPEDETIRVAMATMLSRSRERSAAIEEYQQVLARNPNHLVAKHGLAVTLYADGRIQEAAAEFRGLIDHPLFEELFRVAPAAFDCYQRVIDEAFRIQDLGDVESLVKRWRELAKGRNSELYPVEYNAARLKAFRAGNDAMRRREAAAAFLELDKTAPGLVEKWLGRDVHLTTREPWLEPLVKAGLR